MRMQALARAWAFGRHIPPQKLLRRGQLAARRALVDRYGARLKESGAQLCDDLPKPLFGPRKTGAIRHEGETLVFRFLGREVVFPAARIDWTGANPGPGQGPAHQLWRMNLHYMEYLEEVEDRLFEQLVDDWIGANPGPGQGAWRDGWNAYALSIRVVVWLQQLALRPALEPELRNRMEHSLTRQLGWLARNLETDIGGNHLIKNIKALLWAGAAMQGPQAERWQALGLRHLRREVPRQILPDGVHFERSLSYHAQVLADLLECRSVLPAPVSEIVPGLDDALRRMAQAASDLAHPDGFAAQFGDAGLGMAYAPDHCLDVFAAQIGRRPRKQARFAYRDAGYFGCRTNRMTLIADCGALAPDDLPGHGHGDILSFELSVDGQRVFVDQGVFEYVAGARRDAARAARSHNTLCIEGTDQADFFGAFRMGRRARITACDWQAGQGGATLTGSHDGYAGMSGGARHERVIAAAPEVIALQDRLICQEMRFGRDWFTKRAAPVPAAHLNFLLHPDIATRPESGGILLTGPGDLRLDVRCSAKLRIEPAVWWPDMGIERPTLRLTARLDPARPEAETRIVVLPVPVRTAAVKRPGKAAKAVKASEDCHVAG